MKVRTFLIILLLCIAALGFGCGTRSEMVRASPSDNIAAADTDPLMQKAQSLIEKSPDLPIGYTQLAALFAKRARETGDFDLNSKAETAVGRALELDPADITARKLQASLSLTFHRFSKGLELGTKLQKDFPNDPFVYGVLTDANAELGNYDQAVEAAQKMVDLKPSTASYARVAHLRSLYGDHNGAVEMFKTAARAADPLDKEAQSWCLVQLGDELWKGGNYADAEKVYDEALDNLPNFYLALAGKGRVRAAQGDLAGAEKYLSDVQLRVPNPDAILLLAQVYKLLGNDLKANEQVKLFEAIEEKLSVIGDQKALALFRADNDLKLPEALAIAEQEYILRKDIYTADVYAWCLFKNGRVEEAKKVIDEALRLKTRDARIMYHAGMIDKALGNNKSSRDHLTAAIKLNPAFDLIQASKARMALDGPAKSE